MAAKNVVKKTTGLTGMDVVPKARKVLYGLYNSILTQLEGLPREAAYRQKTEQVVQQRLQVVKVESDIDLLEKKIGCGQVEELIEQAERELSLAKKMADWEPWDQLLSEAPPSQWKWP